MPFSFLMSVNATLPRSRSHKVVPVFISIKVIIRSTLYMHRHYIATSHQNTHLPHFFSPLLLSPSSFVSRPDFEGSVDTKVAVRSHQTTVPLGGAIVHTFKCRGTNPHVLPLGSTVFTNSAVIYDKFVLHASWLSIRWKNRFRNASRGVCCSGT
jgi:hypothetical protein